MENSNEVVLPELPNSRGNSTDQFATMEANPVLASNDDALGSFNTTMQTAKSNKFGTTGKNELKTVTIKADHTLADKIKAHVREGQKDIKTVDIYDPALTYTDIKGIKKQ